MKDNGVKVAKYIGINSSPGKEGQQMSSRRYPVNVSKIGTKGVKLLGINPSPGKEKKMSDRCHPAVVQREFS